MNDELILRARLDAQGYSDEDIVKIMGLPKGAGAASGKLTDRLPGGAARQDKRMGQEGFTANNQALITGQKQVDAQQGYADKMGAKGYETITSVPSGMTDNSISAPLPAGSGGPKGNVKISPQSAMNRNMTTGQPVADDSVTGNNAQADKVKTETTMGADGAAAKTTTTETHNANADTTGEGNGVSTAPSTSQDSTGTGPTTQTPPQQQQAQGQGGVNQQVQGMAQQFQAGQDMQTIQQGKGADKQSWWKDRSLSGKIFDMATFGGTKEIGSTGSGARRKANQQSQQQTQNYQTANQRMNQRAMGMNAPMVATSFDSQLSAYSDVLSLRKSIQERNTTTNLRR
jgi:hypothetical protein